VGRGEKVSHFLTESMCFSMILLFVVPPSPDLVLSAKACTTLSVSVSVAGCAPPSLARFGSCPSMRATGSKAAECASSLLEYRAVVLQAVVKNCSLVWGMGSRMWGLGAYVA
jgi:hypothetical protein